MYLSEQGGYGLFGCAQVLVFSQFKIMLDVIEDSLQLSKYPCERIDGSVDSRTRQQAIDRFTKGTSVPFAASTNLQPTACTRGSEGCHCSHVIQLSENAAMVISLEEISLTFGAEGGGKDTG